MQRARRWKQAQAPRGKDVSTSGLLDLKRSYFTQPGRSVHGNAAVLVNVCYRPTDIPPHVDDILAAKPKSVWFQLGIRNDEASQRLAEAGIKVVQDRCLMVEQGRM